VTYPSEGFGAPEGDGDGADDVWFDEWIVRANGEIAPALGRVFDTEADLARLKAKRRRGVRPMKVTRTLALSIALVATFAAIGAGLSGQTMVMYAWLLPAVVNYWLALEGVETIRRWLSRPRGKG
jgi:hypothetical protein